MPRSPWLASPGWTKSAGVPVEAKVEAILRATWPLLPMPVTTTRPRAAAQRSSAAPKAASSAAGKLFEPLDLGTDHPAGDGKIGVDGMLADRPNARPNPRGLPGAHRCAAA